MELLTLMMWCLWGTWLGVVGHRYGHGFFGYFLLGVLLGPLGLLLAYLNRPRCPYCRQGVHLKATRCPYCQGALADSTVFVPSNTVPPPLPPLTFPTPTASAGQCCAANRDGTRCQQQVSSRGLCWQHHGLRA